MHGDPERPYAQLLKPAAKSQKLLLRLQHKKLLAKPTINHAQAVFALWQKLLQKNIPVTLWPCFADLMLFPDEQYLALLIHPFGQLEQVRQAYGWRYLDGYLLVDQRPEAALLDILDQHLLISSLLADRLGQSAWQAAGRDLAPWQVALVRLLPPRSQDAALDLLQLLRTASSQPWIDCDLPTQLAPAVAAVYFAIWRARGQVVSAERLAVAHPEALAGLNWLVAAILVDQVDGGYRLR